MSIEHTEGRLTATESQHEPNRFMISVPAGWLFSILHNGEALVEKQRVNVRRLVACWNALDGLPTELLERYGATRRGIYKGTEELKAQRDELLAALQSLVGEYEPNIKTFATDAPRKAKWMAALAAIAKAKGGEA